MSNSVPTCTYIMHSVMNYSLIQCYVAKQSFISVLAPSQREGAVVLSTRCRNSLALRSE